MPTKQAILVPAHSVCRDFFSSPQNAFAMQSIFIYRDVVRID